MRFQSCATNARPRPDDLNFGMTQDDEDRWGTDSVYPAEASVEGTLRINEKKIARLFQNAFHLLGSRSNQSINVFNVLGGNWDPTDKKFSSVNSYR